MTTPKKHGKTRKKKHALKNKLIYVSSAIALILICLLVYSHLNMVTFDPTPKAAIVDHLSLTQPNPNFSQTAQDIINETGLPVDYFPSEQVTVDFYRNLPMHNYKLIIFRVHSTGECSVEGMPPFIVFFSSEEYSNFRHVSDQSAMRVVWVNFPEPQHSSTGYFGITPTFIKESLSRNFNDTIIIAMGCDSLRYNTMAEAFIEKGAKVYIGWNGSISAYHTDRATECLLRKLIKDKLAIEKAVEETMKEVGPDPTYKSVLSFYPKTSEAGNYTIQTLNINEISHRHESATCTNVWISTYKKFISLLSRRLPK